MWLLPVPGGPINKTSRGSRMNRPVARSKMTLRLIDGLNAKSNSSRVLEFPEAGGLDAAGDQPLVANEQFILQQQLQELDVGKLVAGGLLQAHVQRSGQARQSQPGQSGLQRFIHKRLLHKGRLCQRRT